MNERRRPPPFPRATFEQRWAALHRDMHAARLDAILVTNIANIRYLTGHAPLIAVAPTRPWYVVLPLGGKPLAIVPELGRADMEREGHVRVAASWASPALPRSPEHDASGEGVGEVLAAFMALPHRFGRVGMEIGAETRIGTSLSDIDAIRAGLDGRDVVDAALLLWSARTLKDDGEIARMADATGAVTRAFDVLPNLLAALPNATDRELHRAFAARALLEGADDVPFLPIGTGPDGYETLTAGPTGRIIETGDVVALDVGARVDGYWCDFDRNFVVGTAAREVAAVHERLWQATLAGLAALRPGRKASAVWHAIRTALDDDGSDNAIGRFGHGVGLDLTEPPSIHPHDHTMLRESMVIAIEPCASYRTVDGRKAFMAHEELAVVMDGPPRLLTTRETKAVKTIQRAEG